MTKPSDSLNDEHDERVRPRRRSDLHGGKTPSPLQAEREPEAGDRGGKRELSPQATRALEEAEARRAARHAQPDSTDEIGGRDGPDPTRFGDWEKDGIVSDF